MPKLITGKLVCLTVHGDGPAVLLIPGVGCGVDFLTPIAKAFPDNALFNIGLPGIDSKLPSWQFTVDDLALDIIALLDKHNIKSCKLLGYSLGGFIAQRLTLFRPDLVERLILLSTSPGGDCMDKDSANVLNELLPSWPVKLDELKNDPAKAFSFVIGKRTYKEHPEAVEAFLNTRTDKPVSNDTYGAHLYCAMRFSSQALIANINCPTLVVHGKEDQLINIRGGKILAGRIPNARFMSFPCGHITPYEIPDIGELVHGFFNDEKAGDKLPPLPPLSAKEIQNDSDWKNKRRGQIGLTAMLAISRGLPVWIKHKLGFGSE